MFHIGIDLGGTNIKAAVVDDDYKIVARADKKTDSSANDNIIALDMANTAIKAVNKANLTMSDISDFGIACPGSVDPVNGIVTYANNLKLKNSPVVKMVSDKLGIKGYIENDANAAAYGELLAGSGVGAKNFIAITLGTGVGGGVIIDKKIYSGFNHSGAEIGHMSICFNGEKCNCGNIGCFEAYASATALIKQSKEAMKKDRSSKMWQVAKTIESVDGRTPFEAMKLGDETAAKVIDRYTDYLACGITSLINIFQPEFICIGGGVSYAGDALLEPLCKKVYHSIYNRNAKENKLTVIKKAALGNDAGIIGAANLYKLF